MKQSNGETVWKHEEKKWKPRTFQSAKVFFPAHDLHRPPEAVKEPVYAETHAQKMEREGKERDKRIAEHLAKYGPPKERARRRLPFGQKHKPKPKKCIKNFAAKQAKKLAKLVAECAQSTGRIQ